MDDISDRAGRLLADRYRLPQTLADSYQLTESVAYDTASGQEVLVRQVPLPEVVDAEVLGDGGYQSGRGAVGRATRTPADPAVRRALEAAQQAAALPDHPRLDQVFDVFVEGDGLWIVSELLPATPLASLLEHQTIGAHRAAEIAADLLTALRAVHAHGWTHGNVTPRTVLICDDGRALLTGLAVGAAQEALCGYDPLPDADRVTEPPRGRIGSAGPEATGESGESGDGRDRGERGVGGDRRVGGDGGVGGDRAERAGGGQVLPGIALPEGFDEQPREDANGPEPTVDLGLLRRSQDAPGGARGIFGLQGLDGLRDRDAERQSGTPAGTPPGGASPGGAPGRGPEGAADGVREGAADGSPGVRDEWWRRPSPEPPADDPHCTPDDYVRWLPAGEDEVTPDELPAQRQPFRFPAQGRPRSVRAVTGPAEPEGTVPDRAGPDGAGSDGTDADGGARADDAGSAGAARTAAGDAVPGGGADGGAAGDTSAGSAGDTSAGSAGDASGGVSERPGASGGFRGPATPLAAERARQARMTVVGAVGERWAPEQARPVRRDARQGPPVGPAADLWALGVLLYRAVQGRAPYPEEDVAELVRLVCGEPPAPGDEVGVLRPVVVSLLRRHPTERPDFEELRGHLRSLLRAAPEPEAGWHTIYAPALDPAGTTDSRRLPILRRRGELVRRRRRFRRAVRAEQRQRKQNVRTYEQRGPRLRQDRRQAAAPPPPEPPYGRTSGQADEQRPYGRRPEGTSSGVTPYEQQPYEQEPYEQQPYESPEFEPQAYQPQPYESPRFGPQPSEPARQEQREAPAGRGEPQPEPTRHERTPYGQSPYGQSPYERTPHEQARPEQAYRQRPGQASAPVPPPPRQAPTPPKPAVRLKNTRPPKAKPSKRSKPPKPYVPADERPRRLGALLLGLVLAGLVAGLTYAVLFMPGSGDDAAGQQRGSVGGESREPGASGGPDGSGGGDEQPPPSGTEKPVPEGYKLSRDPAGFQVAVPEEWNRRSTTGRGQVRYNGGPVEMVIVNGRDGVRKYGRDPMAYQSDHEPELRAYRASQWATTTGLRRIDVGATAMAEGTFSWKDGDRDVYARNRAMIVDGRYHVLMVLGSKSQRGEIDRHFEAVADTYRAARG